MYFSEFWRQEAKSTVPAWLDKGPHFRFIASTFSPCPHMLEGTRNLCGISFTRSLMTFMRAPPSWPNPLLKRLWRWGSQHKNFEQDRTQIFRPWHWYTWRTWGKSREFVSSWSSGWALIQKQVSPLCIIKPWTLEDLWGVYERSDPRPCWTSWTELFVVPCFFALPDFVCVTYILLIKRATRGKVWRWGKGLSQRFFKKNYQDVVILKSKFNYGIRQVFNCRQKRLGYFIQYWNKCQLWDTSCHTCNLRNFQFNCLQLLLITTFITLLGSNS